MSQTQPTRWEALTEVARRCVAEKQFDKAEEAFLAALREAEQFGDTDQRVTATLNALARVYHRRSKFFPAAALLHRLLGIKEREHGDQHPELAGILSNLAEMYARLGDARQELELRERALRIRTDAGETEGGALEGLRNRIDELQTKLAEERARDEAARTAPARRIPVPTGATDLPLIIPTIASPQYQPMASAFAPARKADVAPARKAEFAPAPVPRVATPASVVEETTPAPLALAPIAPVAPRVPSPAETRIAIPEPAREPEPVRRPSPVDAVDVVAAPFVPFAPIASPAPETPVPLAPTARQVSDSAPALPVWQPIAPPAPTLRWPGDAEPAREPERDPTPDYSAEDEISFAPRRNFRPLAYGGLVIAAAALVAALVFGGPETADSASGSLAAQPVAAPAPEPRTPAPPKPVPGEAEALEAGLANLQQENAALPAAAGSAPLVYEGGENLAPSSSGAQNAVPPTDSQEQRLRVQVPALRIDNVSKSIEAAARARMDSITQANDKQVYEYSGKKPRQ